MGDMSEAQERALEEFRAYIKDNNVVDHPQFDDYYLLRFLRARKFDMEKTKIMFHNFIDWRKENDVDNIIDVSYQLLYSLFWGKVIQTTSYKDLFPTRTVKIT